MPYVRLVNTAANLKILDKVENINSIFMPSREIPT